MFSTKLSLLFFSLLSFFSVIVGLNTYADTPPLDGFYLIKSVQAGSANAGYWDQPGHDPSYKTGANLAVWAKDGLADQQFQFKSAGGDWYYIISQNGGTVDVAGGVNKNGNNIHIWDSNKTASQKFRFKHLGNNRWKIYTSWGKVLCTGRRYNNGSNIHTWDDHNGPWMEWVFEKTGPGQIAGKPNAGQVLQNIKDTFFDNLSTRFESDAEKGEVNLAGFVEFSSLELPGKIKLKKVGVQVRKTETEKFIFLSGEAEIYNKPVNVLFGISPNPDFNKGSSTPQTPTKPNSKKTKQPKYRIFLWGSVQGEWQAGKSIPGIKRIPILKNLTFNDSGVLFSNTDISFPLSVFPENSQNILKDHLGEETENLEAGKGVNLFGETSLKGIPLLDKARKLFALKPGKKFHALISPDPDKSFISGKFAEFGTPKFFPKWFKGTSLTMRLQANGSIILSIPVTVELPPKKDKVTFSVEVALTKGKGKAGARNLTLAVAGRMEGKWNNALGIKGFALEDVVISGETALTKASLSIGMGSTFYIGSKQVSLAALLPVTPNISSLAFKAFINSIGLTDIVQMASKIMEKATGKKIPLAKLPMKNIEFRNLGVSFAPAGGSETLGIEQGISFQGTLYINNKMISDTFFKTSEEGVFIKQNISPFKLGPLHITGGPGMEKKGPLLDLALTSNLADNHLIFTGGAKLFGALAAVSLDFQENQLDLKGNLKLFNLYEANIQGNMNMDPKNFNLYARIEIVSNFAEEMNKLVNGELKDKIQEINKKLERNKKKANQDITKAQDKCDRAKDRVRKLNDQIKNAEEDMNRRMGPLNHKLSSAINRLNQLKKEESNTWNDFKNARKIQKPRKWAKHAAVKAARVTAQKAMQAAQKAVNFMAKRLNPRIVSLKTAKNSALIALTVAEKALEVAKIIHRETTEAVQLVNKGIVKGADFLTSGAVFNFNRGVFEGELGKMTNGAAVAVEVDFVFLKKPYKKKFKAALKNPAKIAKDLAKLIFKEIKDKIL